MARVLRRPMFRMGGNTDQGIMSGVAPRQGYANGEDVQPVSKLEKRFLEERALSEKYAPTRGRGDLSQFLIDFGLDVASATPSGSILSTAAASAKDPYARYTAQKEARLADKDKFTRAMISDISEQISEETEWGKGKKTYEFSQKQAAFEKLQGIENRLADEMAKLQRDKENMPPTAAGTSIIDDQIARKQTQIDQNAETKSLFMDKIEDPFLKYLFQGMAAGTYTPQEVKHYIETGELPEMNATGGRVGYATAGQVIPGEMPRTAQADVIQSMSFEDLRSRLPSTITNDVIQLLAKSQEALVEFSNIQTESDIRSFNRKYEVNLVLPAEA